MGARGQGSEEVIKSKQSNPKADSNLLTQNLSRDDTAEMTKVSLFISSKNSNSKNPVRGSLKKSEEEVEEEDKESSGRAYSRSQAPAHPVTGSGSQLPVAVAPPKLLGQCILTINGGLAPAWTERTHQH